MDEQNSIKLYNALLKDYDMGSYEQFASDIQDEEKRRKLYDAIKDDFDLPDFDGFSSQLGIGTTTQPTQQSGNVLDNAVNNVKDVYSNAARRSAKSTRTAKNENMLTDMVATAKDASAMMSGAPHVVRDGKHGWQAVSRPTAATSSGENMLGKAVTTVKNASARARGARSSSTATSGGFMDRMVSSAKSIASGARSPQKPKGNKRLSLDQYIEMQDMFANGRNALAGQVQAGKKRIKRQASDPLKTSRFKTDWTGKSSTKGITASGVKRGENQYNAQTGKMEPTYVDEYGNEYGSLAEANVAQTRINEQNSFYDLLNQQLADIYDQETSRAEEARSSMMDNFGHLPEASFGAAIAGEQQYRQADPVGNTIRRLMSESPEVRKYLQQMTDYYVQNGEEPAMARQRASEALQSMVMSHAMQKMMPDNNVTYVLMNAFANSFPGLITRASTTAGGAKGNGVYDSLASGALREYGEKKASGTAKVLGAVSPLVVDIATGGFALPSAAGGIATNAFTRLAGTAGGRLLGIGADAATRRVASNLGVQLLGASIGGAVNFGVYNTQSALLRGVAEGNVDADTVGEEAWRGVKNGFVFGTVGGVMGKLTGNLTGKAAIAGELATIGAEGATFVALDAMEGQPITAESVATSFGMALGGRAGHPMKYINNMAARYRGEVGPVQKVRLSDETYNALKEKYPAVSELLHDQSVITDITKLAKQGVSKDYKASKERSKALSKEGDELLNRYEKELEALKNDKSVPWEVVRMAEWVLNGKMMPEPAILGFKPPYKDENGRWRGVTVDQNGRAIATYDLGKSESKAIKWQKAMLNTTLRNQTVLAEGLARNKSYADALQEAVNNVAETQEVAPEQVLSVFTKVFNKVAEARKDLKEGEELDFDKLVIDEDARTSDVYKDIYNKVIEAAKAAHPEFDIVNQVKAEILGQQGIDIDEVLKKNPSRLTAQERGALNYYLQEIMGEEVSQGEQTNREMGDRYLLGYNSQEGDGSRRASQEKLDAAEQRAIGELPPEVMAALEEYPEQIDNILANSGVELSESAQQAARDYAAARSEMDGVLQRVRDDIDAAVRQSDQLIDSRMHREDQGGDGMVRMAKINGEDVYIISGKIAIGRDGTIDIENSDKGIIVVDGNGEKRMVDINDLEEIYDPVDPAQLKKENADALRESMAQKAADEIEGTLPFADGDEYQVIGDDNAVHVIRVINSNADGLTVNVTVDGGQEVLPMSKEQLQEWADRVSEQQLQPADDMEVENGEEVESKKEEVQSAAAPEATTPPSTTSAGIVSDLNQPMPKTEDGKTDYSRVTPERAHHDIYNERGLSKERADKVVEAAIAKRETEVAEAQKAVEKAQKALEKAQNKDIDVDNIDADLAEEQKLAEALRDAEDNAAKVQADVDYWRQVKAVEDAKNAPTTSSEPAKITAPLSNEVNEFGKPFVLSSDGTTTFGEVDPESGLKAAPIKLSLGENTVDEEGRNHGYGLLHIEAGHGDQIRKAGFKSIEEFVETVAKNYETIREGGVVGKNKTYLLEISDGHNNTLFVQLSNDGSYWNINSAGIFREAYSRRKPIVASVPTIGNGSSTKSVEVNRGKTKGATTTSGNSSTTSVGKDNTDVSNVQENSGEISEKNQPRLPRDVAERKERFPEEFVLSRGADRFTTYGDDAIRLGQILGREVVPDPNYGPTLSFPRDEIDSILPRLVREGLRVAVTDEVPEAGEVQEQRETTPSTLPTEEEIALRDGLVDVLRDAGLDVITDDVEGQKVLEAARQARPQEDNGTMLQKVRSNPDLDNATVFEASKRTFGITNDLREAGYILPDGTMLDFSGRHWVDEGKDSSHLAGRRAVDHRNISDIAYDKDENETGIETDMSDFINRGAIRIHKSDGFSSINLSVAPTPEQAKVIRRLVESSRGDVTVDFGDGNTTEHYAEYEGAKPTRVIGDIDRYFNEGIKPEGNIRFFKTPEGDVYGYVKDGKIYIDPKIATAETPVHEYSHLWGDALKKANPKAWERLKETMLGEKDLLEYVKSQYPGLEGDALIGEVFSHYSGRRGAERLRAEMEREMAKAKGATAKARVAKVFDTIRRALNRFWEMARDLFAGKNANLKDLTAEDFADMALNDMLRGFKPEVESKGDAFYSNAERAVENIKQNKATAEQWLAMIKKNGGLKAGEDKWMGLSQWLEENKGKSLTKEEVQQFIADNSIQMEETNYSEGLDSYAIYNRYGLGDYTFGDEGALPATEWFDLYYGGIEFQGSLDDRFQLAEIVNNQDHFVNPENYNLNSDNSKRNFIRDVETELFKFIQNENIGKQYLIESNRLEYTTEGLDNKREIAFVVPTVESYQENDEVHFGPENQGKAVMWVRFGETTDADGKRVLVIDEIQSNRHQDAREKGYANSEELKQRAEGAKKEMKDFFDQMQKKYKTRFWGTKCTPEENEKYHQLNSKYNALLNSGVPSAPFEKNWHEVAMKRMLRLAAEEGFDKVAWTTGEQQAKRYDIGNMVEDLFYKKNEDGTYTVSVNTKDTRGHGAGRYTDYGEKTFADQSEADLTKLLGKEVAQKIIDGKGRKGYTHNNEKGWTTFKGKDLYVGGEGMKGFYDNMLPRFMDKYGKRWGVKTGTVELPNVEKAGRTMHSVDVTPEMKESVMEGQPLFQKVTNEKERNDILRRNGTSNEAKIEEGYRDELGSGGRRGIDSRTGETSTTSDTSSLEKQVNKLSSQGNIVTPGHVELNVATMRDPESRRHLQEVMDKEGWSKEAQQQFVDMLEDVADFVIELGKQFPRLREWNEREITSDKEDEEYNRRYRYFVKNKLMVNRPAFVKNGEYPWNIDLGTLCTKRESFDALVQIITEKGMEQNLGPTQIEAIKSLLQNNGFLTACDVCFNEARRARFLTFANDISFYWNSVRTAAGITDNKAVGEPREFTYEQEKKLRQLAGREYKTYYNRLVPKDLRRDSENDNGLTAAMARRMAKMFLSAPSIAGVAEPGIFLGSANIDKLLRTYGPYTKLEGILKNAWGSGTPKPIEGFNLYDPLSWRDQYDNKQKRPTIDWFFNNGGMRAQSFTDYHPVMFFDYLQMFTDLAVRRLPIHIYTKVPALIKLFGKTGAKFNMSLVPEIVDGVDAEHAGLKPDGKGGWDYAWHEDSFPADEAFKLREDPNFKNNVGTIAVGVSRAQILKMLDDPTIDMVIPFHGSGMPGAVKIKTGLDKATDYQDVQNTGGKPKNAKDFNFNEALRKLRDPRAAADAYKEWCKKNGYTPKFEEFSDHPNYYKVLEDFRVVETMDDGTLAYHEQEPVVMRLPENWKEVLIESLSDKTMQEGLKNQLLSNEELLNDLEKVLSKPRLDGDLRDVVMTSLERALGKGNIISLAENDFFKELEKAYSQGMGAEEAKNKVEVLRNSEGIVYGFTDGKRIVLNENHFNAETPMHEFTHIYGLVAQKVDPELWEEGKELLKQSEEWQEVMDDDVYSDIHDDEDAVAREAWARIEQKEMGEFVKGINDPSKKRLTKQGIYAKIKDWARRMFGKVRSLFAKSNRKLTYDELKKMPMKAVFDEAEAKRFQEAKKATEDAEESESDIELEVSNGQPEDTGVSDEELANYDAGKNVADAITQGLMNLAASNQNNIQLRLNAIRKFGDRLIGLAEMQRKLQEKLHKKRKVTLKGDLLKNAKELSHHDFVSNLGDTAQAQLKYDKSTVDDIIRLTKMVMKTGFFKDMSTYEVKRLLSAINKGVGVEDLTPIANNVVDVLVKHQLRESKALLQKLMREKGSKVDSRGVEVQAGLDIAGQRMMRGLKDGMELDADGIEARINDCENRLDSEDDVVKKNAMDEYQGLMLAKQWHDTIRSSEKEEVGLRNEKRDAEERIYDFRRVPVVDKNGNVVMNQDGTMRTTERKTLKPEFKNNVTDENNQLRKDTEEEIAAIEQSIRDNHIERVDAYTKLMSVLAGDIKGSRERAAEWRQAQLQRVEDIHHNANSDLLGVDVKSQNKTPEGGLLAINSNNDIVRLLFQPLATFEKMMRFFGRKAHNGEGYLFNRYMRGWVDSNDKEWRSKRAAHEELDAKVSEIMGKDMRWSDLFKLERKSKYPTIPVEYWDNGERVADELSQGEALSLYMWNKMQDAKPGLRRMGISEDDIETIKGLIDPKFIELADWIQNEFLPGRRSYYNEVYERMFGAPMAAIADYFPIVRQKRDLPTNDDITQRGMQDVKASTVTGNIMKRVRNAATLDIHTDAFDLVLKHLDDMENWAAWAEFNRDINTLRNYKRFKNKVLNMNSLEYGAGKDLWNAFDKACSIVAGVYGVGSDRGKADALAVNVAKGVTGAKIAFRIYTAAKQLLSLPAFWNGDANLVNSAKWFNPAGAVIAWGWAMEKLPGFSKRWQSRQAGDVRLKDTDSDYTFWRNNIVQHLSRGGMWANAVVDGITCAMGAHAVYDTKKARYLKDGYSEEQAEKRALQDAAISYNSSQQSSENAFVSPIQADRTWQSTIFTVFRTASMGYQRRLTTGLRNLKARTKPGFAAESIEFMKKQMERDGIPEDKAEKAAKRIYRWGGLRAAADVFVFGFVLPFFWNLGPYVLYLLFGDDDEKKEEMLKDASVHSMFGPIEGLTGGNAYSEIGNLTLGNMLNDDDKQNIGQLLKNRDFLSMPVSSDVKKLFGNLGKDNQAAWNNAFNLLVQAGVGVNPETFTDVYAAIADYCDGDPQTTKEFAMLLMRITQVPQSTIDELYIDELGLKGKDAKKLNVLQLADRYARYKKLKNAPLMNWNYDSGQSQDILDKYRKRFLDDMQERVEKMSDEQLESNFENASDSLRREAVAKAYFKKDGMKDQAGKKPASNWNPDTRRYYLRYQGLRTWEDISEDKLVELKLQQAKNRGDEKTVKKINSVKKEIGTIKKDLGKDESKDPKIMERIGAKRKKLLEGLDKQ